MASAREFEEEMFAQEIAEIAKLPAGTEERRMREQNLAALQAMARRSVNDINRDDQNEAPSQEQIQRFVYIDNKEAQLVKIIREKKKAIKEEEERRKRERRRMRRAASSLEHLVPWLNESRSKAEELVGDVRNMINTLYHCPTRQLSLPEFSAIPPGERAVRQRSRTAEPVMASEERANQAVTENAFYRDIQKRMKEVLQKALILLNSIPVAVAAISERSRTTPTTPPVIISDQAVSHPVFDHLALHLQGAEASAASHIQVSKDFENIDVLGDLTDWREYRNASRDAKKECPKHKQRSRHSAEHHPKKKTNPFSSKSPPPTKSSKSKVPTPRNISVQKPTEKDINKPSKTNVVDKPFEKDPTEKRKRSSEKGESEKETVDIQSEKNKVQNIPKKDTIQQSSSSEQKTKNTQMYGARPKTTSTSVWREPVTSTPKWKVSLSDLALGRNPVEENFSPSSRYTGVLTPVGENPLGITECDDVGNALAPGKSPRNEFSGPYSSGQFSNSRLPVKKSGAHVVSPGQAQSADHDISTLKLATSSQSPVTNRPDVREVGDVGASDDLDIGVLKVVSPIPIDNIPDGREIGISDEFGKQRIAPVGFFSRALSVDLEKSALKLPSTSQIHSVALISSRKRIEASEKASVPETSKITTSSTKASSARVSKGASSSGVSKGGYGVSKGASGVTISKGASGASVSKGASGASVSKGASGASVSKGASGASVSKGASGVSVSKGACNTRALKGSLNTNLSKVTSLGESKGTSNTSVPKGRNKFRPKDSFYSITSKYSGVSGREIGSTGVPERKAAITMTGRASSTTSITVPKIVAKGISGVSKEPTFSGSKLKSSMQPSTETSVSVIVASQEENTSIKASSTQLSKATVSEEEANVSVPFSEPAGINPKDPLAAQTSEATVSGEETSVSVPSVESDDMDSKEWLTTQSSEATASEDETGVGIQFAESADIGLKQTLFKHSSIATESNSDISVAEETSVVNALNVEYSQAKGNVSEDISEVLDSCQSKSSSEPATQTKPVSRQSLPTNR